MISRMATTVSRTASPPFLGLAAGLVGHPGGVPGVLGVAAHRGVDRLQAAGDLLKRRRLLVRALGQLVGARVQLVARRRDRRGHRPDLADHLGELVDHRIDLARQVAQLVAPLDVGAVVELALVQLLA